MTDRPRVVIAGASGFIGPAVARAFERDGYEVQRIGRAAATTWDDSEQVARVIDGSAVVVNLAGKSVDCRYTDSNRDEILRSRVDTTRALRNAVANAASPPRVAERLDGDHLPLCRGPPAARIRR